MSLSIDLFISNIFFTINLLPHFITRERNICNRHTYSTGEQPLVSVILALRQESHDAVYQTVNSIIQQTYPKELLQVLLIVDADDHSTQVIAESAKRSL